MPDETTPSRWNALNIFGVIIVAAILALTVLILTSSSSDDSSGDLNNANPGEEKTVAVVSKPELLAESADSEDPVYWVGEREGAELELTRIGDGRVYIRYLTDGAVAADPRSDFLTIGSYPVVNAVQALQRTAATNKSTVLAKSDDGAVMLINKANPSSIYIAYPGADTQIEVYDPDPQVALELAKSGIVKPVS